MSLGVRLFPGASVLGDRDRQEDGSAHASRGTVTVSVVCDAIGSRPDGAACSVIAARTAASYLSVLGRRRRAARYVLGVPTAVANRLRAEAQAARLHPDAATVLAAAAVEDDVCWSVTVGDCRVTLVRDGVPVDTTDPHEVESERRRGVGEGATGAGVTRWIAASGIPASPATVQCWSIQPNDAVVLTSDGVHERLDLRRVARVVSDALAAGQDPVQAVLERLREAKTGADDNGAADNATISCLVVTPTRERGGR